MLLPNSCKYIDLIECLHLLLIRCNKRLSFLLLHCIHLHLLTGFLMFKYSTKQNKPLHYFLTLGNYIFDVHIQIFMIQQEMNSIQLSKECFLCELGGITTKLMTLFYIFIQHEWLSFVATCSTIHCIASLISSLIERETVSMCQGSIHTGLIQAKFAMVR